VGGRPSRTPLARLTASASFVRCEINLRSNCANVASMFAIASPAGVVVSTARSRATSAQLLAHDGLASPALRGCDLVDVGRREQRLNLGPVHLPAAALAGIRGERTSSTVAGFPKPSRTKNSIAAS
jgi:hypothetical protein